MCSRVHIAISKQPAAQRFLLFDTYNLKSKHRFKTLCCLTRWVSSLASQMIAQSSSHHTVLTHRRTSVGWAPGICGHGGGQAQSQGRQLVFLHTLCCCTCSQLTTAIGRMTLPAGGTRCCVCCRSVSGSLTQPRRRPTNGNAERRGRSARRRNELLCSGVAASTRCSADAYCLLQSTANAEHRVQGMLLIQ